MLASLATSVPSGVLPRVKIDAKGGSSVACSVRALLRRQWLERHRVPELLELADEPFRALFERAALVEVVGPEFFVGDLALEDVVGGDEDRVAEGAGCLAGAAPAAQPAVLGAEVSALAARGRFRRLGQCRIEPVGALAWLSRAKFAGRLGSSVE